MVNNRNFKIRKLEKMAEKAIRESDEVIKESEKVESKLRALFLL